MRYILVLAVAAVLWYHYHTKMQKQRRASSRPPGVQNMSRRKNVTQFSSTGSASPGSGVPSVQPALATTWGIGGDYSPGYTGPSYRRGR